MNLYRTAFGQLNNNTDKICGILGGMSADNNAATAALTVVANAILNLDEVLTKN